MSRSLLNLAKGAPFRFKPGNCANPTGRPAYKSLSEACKEILVMIVPGDKLQRTYCELIALTLVTLALHGNLDAVSELFDRVEGQPRQAIDLVQHQDPLGDLLAEMRKKSSERDEKEPIQ